MERTTNNGSQTISGITLITIEAIIESMYGQIETYDLTDMNLLMFENPLVDVIRKLYRERGFDLNIINSNVRFRVNGNTVEIKCNLGFDAVDQFPEFCVMVPCEKLCKR